MAVSIDLSGRVAVVTGGAGGIGEGVARALQEAGAHVVLLDRDDRRFAELADVGTGVTADLTDPRSVDGALARVEAEVGPIDVLVNNAGIQSAQLGMPFMNQSAADWQRTFAVNVVGTFHAAKAVAPAMLERGSGAIVNVASVSGRTGFQTDPAYSASKAAVLNFTQAMARDLAPAVRVNAVCPGMVFTPFYAAQHAAAVAQGATAVASPGGVLRREGRSPHSAPARPAARGDRSRGPVPRLRSRRLDHGPGPERGRWPGDVIAARRRPVSRQGRAGRPRAPARGGGS
jgi:NAD(P)-dependent dehydrogenase (short-subunit alcohol dehydrogenase family)